MTGSVCNVGDEVEIFTLCPAEKSVNGVDHDLDDVDILPFVETADVVGFSYLAFMEDEVDCSCMILHVKPVPYVLALAVNWKRLSVLDIVDEQRDKLLRELVWTIVVRAVCNDCRHAVGVVVCSHEMVTACLCC